MGIGTDNFIDVNFNLPDGVFTGVYIFNGIGYDIANFITATSSVLYASLGQGFFDTNPQGCPNLEGLL